MPHVFTIDEDFQRPGSISKNVVANLVSQYQHSRVRQFELSLDEDVNRLFTKENLAQFFEDPNNVLLKDDVIFDVTFISRIPTDSKVTSDAIKIFLGNKICRDKMTDASFLRLMTYTKAVEDFVVTDKDVQQRLIGCLERASDDDFKKLLLSSKEISTLVMKNVALKKRLDMLENGSNCQTFSHSCAAWSILNFLKEIFPEFEYSRSKELEIYQHIWTKPGEEADPEKIIDFFVKKLYLNLNESKFDDKDTQIDIVGVEVTDVTQKLTTTADAFKDKLRLFHKATTGRLDKFKDASELSGAEFNAGLLIEHGKQGTSYHVYFAKKNQDGKLVVTDPAPGSGKPVTYDSFNDYYSKRAAHTTGISFNLSGDASPKSPTRKAHT